MHYSVIDLVGVQSSQDGNPPPSPSLPKKHHKMIAHVVPNSKCHIKSDFYEEHDNVKQEHGNNNGGGKRGCNE
jgi:hypothetical protein